VCGCGWKSTDGNIKIPMERQDQKMKKNEKGNKICRKKKKRKKEKRKKKKKTKMTDAIAKND
jgi:hypothetical protein